MGNASSVNADLLSSVKKGEIDKVKQLCSDKDSKNSLDINFRDENLATPLMWACYMGHIKIFELLISFGGNLTDCDRDGYTALHYAVTEKKVNVVKLLVTKYKNKLNINCKNNQGDTPLHRSIYYSLKDISSILITNGADINSVNNINETPLDKARKNEIKEWIISLGGKYNVKKQEIEGNDDKKINDNNILSEDDKQYIRRIEMKNKVIEWLKVDLSFPEYVDNFIENGYDRFDAIIAMNRDDLKDINIKMGHIKIILSSINQYKINQQNIKQFEKLNQPGMNNNDINEEIEEIEEIEEKKENQEGDGVDHNDNHQIAQ